MMKIPKSAKIRIDAQGQALKGTIEFADKDTITLDNVDSINTVLRNIYEKEGKTLGDLINEKRIIINSSKVWEKYNLSNGKFFIRNERVKDDTVITRSDPVIIPSDPVIDTEVIDEPKKDDDTVVVSDPVVVSEDTPAVVSTPVVVTDLDEDKKDEPVVYSDGAIPVTGTDTEEKSKSKSKTKVKLKKIGVAALAILAGGVILCGGLKNVFKKNSNTNNNRNNNRNVDNTSVPPVQSDEQVIADMAQEEVIYNDSDNDEYTTGYADPTEFVEEGPVYDYTGKGSVVKYDDMETQIQVVNEICDSLQPCELENLVAGSDYNAIHTICCMRNDVLNGKCSPEYFTNCIISYTYENSTVFGDTPIVEFGTLSPYAKYIVIVASDTILPLCNTNYEYTTQENVYRLEDLYDSYDYMTNDLYRYLTDKPKYK